MDLRPYVDNLLQEMMVVAEAGGGETRALAERLVAPLDSATRLMLLSALSAAAEEITRELAPGLVDVRLRGTDPSFVVTPPAADRPFVGDTSENGFEDMAGGSSSSAMRGSSSGTPGDEGATARINFRPPEQLKVRIEEAAGREGLSVNAWLVRAVAATLSSDGREAERRTNRGDQQYVGWVR